MVRCGNSINVMGTIVNSHSRANDRLSLGSVYMIRQLVCEILNANYLKQEIECPGIFQKH